MVSFKSLGLLLIPLLWGVSSSAQNYQSSRGGGNTINVSPVQQRGSRGGNMFSNTIQTNKANVRARSINSLSNGNVGVLSNDNQSGTSRGGRGAGNIVVQTQSNDNIQVLGGRGNSNESIRGGRGGGNELVVSRGGRGAGNIVVPKQEKVKVERMQSMELPSLDNVQLPSVQLAVSANVDVAAPSLDINMPSLTLPKINLDPNLNLSGLSLHSEKGEKHKRSVPKKRKYRKSGYAASQGRLLASRSKKRKRSKSAPTCFSFSG